MAGPPNEYRTLRTINTLLLRGAGFSIAVKTRKKTTRRKKTRKKKEGMMDVHRYCDIFVDSNIIEAIVYIKMF